jgi:hypothetical protein
MIKFGRRQEGVANEGGHFEECFIFIDKVCEHQEVLVV